MKKMTFLAVSGAMALVVSCGKNEVLNKQENQRTDLRPELQGSWISNCESKQIHVVTLQGDAAQFERVDYFDPECQDRVRTTRHSGKFNLAHTFKEGVLNSIIFVADNDVKVTLHTEYEIEAQNNVLSRVSKETETEIDPKSTPVQKKTTTRENLKIRATKALSLWTRDEEKSLNRLQLEKLRGLGLEAGPVAEQGSRPSLRYEVDNGYLQLAGPGDFARVYTKR